MGVDHRTVYVRDRWSFAAAHVRQYAIRDVFSFTRNHYQVHCILLRSETRPDMFVMEWEKGSKQAIWVREYGDAVHHTSVAVRTSEVFGERLWDCNRCPYERGV